METIGLLFRLCLASLGLRDLQDLSATLGLRDLKDLWDRKDFRDLRDLKDLQDRTLLWISNRRVSPRLSETLTVTPQAPGKASCGSTVGSAARPPGGVGRRRSGCGPRCSL